MLFFTVGDDNAGDEDEPLWRAARGGDTAAFEALIRKYEKLVYRTAYFTTKNAEDAADLTQEILLKVWHGLPTYRGNARFSTWLIRLARNACCDYVRGQMRTVPTQPIVLMPEAEEGTVHAEPNDPSPDADPHTVYSREEQRVMLRAAMARLTSEQREILILRDINGDTYESIASALSLELGTVKSRLFRARSRLRELLADMGFFE